MKILVVAPQPFFTPRGTPLSVYHRTRIAAELGAEIELLTYGEGRDAAIPGVRTVRIPHLRALEPIPTGPSFTKALLDVAMVLWTVALLIARRPDVVWAHEEAVFWCRPLKPIFRFRLVYDMHSSLPEQLANFRFTSSSLLVGLFRWLEDAALRASDAVITICPALESYATGRMPDPARQLRIENSLIDPVELVPAAGEPTSAIEPAPSEALAGWIPRGRRAVVYAGTLESYQGIELLLRAFRRVPDRRPEAFLVVAGGRPEQVEHYAGLAAELGLEHDSLFTGSLPPATARCLEQRASVLVSPRVVGQNTPLKIYALLASGVPLVATDVPSHTQVLDRHVAFLAKPDPEGLAAALVEALSDVEGARTRTEAARRLYEERYASGAYRARMRSVFEILRG